jgi:hypothetical protein
MDSVINEMYITNDIMDKINSKIRYLANKLDSYSAKMKSYNNIDNRLCERYSILFSRYYLAWLTLIEFRNGFRRSN